jgi:hypothetical protein
VWAMSKCAGGSIQSASMFTAWCWYTGVENDSVGRLVISVVSGRDGEVHMLTRASTTRSLFGTNNV